MNEKYEQLHQLVATRLKFYVMSLQTFSECKEDKFNEQCRECLSCYQNVYLIFGIKHPILDFSDLYGMSEKDFMEKYLPLIKKCENEV